MSPRRLNLKAGSDAWHRWRDGGVGGTDACAVMGVSPWETRAALLARKLSARPKGPSAGGGRGGGHSPGRCQRGQRLEPVARRLYEERTGRRMTPACVQHGLYPYLRAQIDGLSECGDWVLEVKCPHAESHAEALAGKYPEHYRPQLQLQMVVTGASGSHYASYDPDNFGGAEQLAVVAVAPEPDYQRELVRRCREFWEEVQAARRGRAAIDLTRPAPLPVGYFGVKQGR